jgi:hypothetical protein
VIATRPRLAMKSTRIRHQIFPAPALVALLSAFTPLIPAARAAQVWLFDFGSNQLTTGQAQAWNNITQAIGTNSNASLLDLVDSTGQITAVDFQMIARFSGENTNGTASTTLGYPPSATSDSLYGNTELFQTQQNNFPKFKLTSLDPGLEYDLTFYASRLSVSDNRETLYTVIGSSISSGTLNVANNSNNQITLFDVMPNQFGEIEVDISPGTNNNNANHFTYLGVLTVAVPEPASAIFLVAGAGLFLARRQRRAA